MYFTLVVMHDKKNLNINLSDQQPSVLALQYYFILLRVKEYNPLGTINKFEIHLTCVVQKISETKLNLNKI